MEMIEYDLSEHAAEAIAERDIELRWVEQVLSSPELVIPDPEDEELEHHYGKIAEYGNRVLRVVFNKGVIPIRIVTAYFDRSMKGRLWNYK